MIIKVNIWDILAGAVYWDKQRNVGVFEYDKSFIEKNIDISPLLMPLREGVLYQFPDLNFDTFNGLPPTIADSLPDDFGNIIMNTWLSKKGITINDLIPTERLSYIGKRGMGALEYEPVLDNISDYKSEININELVEIANKVLLSKRNDEYSSLDEKSLLKILQIGTSAGGARAKAILAYDEKNNVYKPGDIIHGEGHSYWILKMDGISNKILGDPQGYGKIEYAYYKMAVDSGIEMTESRLLHENNLSHFITKRFDRVTKGEKIHKQTLGGLAGMDYKQSNMYSYEQVFTVLRRMQLQYKNIEQQYKRMVFNVVARNQDDHVKNISLLMNKQGKWVLSPAYDISYSHNPSGIWTNNHQLSINGKRDNFTIADFLKIGKENNIRKRNDIINQIIDTVSNWKKYAKEAGVEKENVLKIEKGLRLFNRISIKYSNSTENKSKNEFITFLAYVVLLLPDLLFVLIKTA